MDTEAIFGAATLKAGMEMEKRDTAWEQTLHMQLAALVAKHQEFLKMIGLARPPIQTLFGAGRN